MVAKVLVLEYCWPVRFRELFRWLRVYLTGLKASFSLSFIPICGYKCLVILPMKSKSFLQSKQQNKKHSFLYSLSRTQCFFNLHFFEHRLTQKLNTVALLGRCKPGQWEWGEWNEIVTTPASGDMETASHWADAFPWPCRCLWQVTQKNSTSQQPMGWKKNRNLVAYILPASPSSLVRVTLHVWVVTWSQGDHSQSQVLWPVVGCFMQVQKCQEHPETFWPGFWATGKKGQPSWDR